MMLRTLLSLVNLGTIAVAIVVLLAYPRYAGEAFYLLLGWMFGSLVLAYGPWANRPVLSGGSGTAGTTDASPLPSGGSFDGIGFCIYCGAPVASGLSACPACHHRYPQV